MEMGLLFPFILYFSLTPDFGTAEALLLLESSREFRSRNLHVDFYVFPDSSLVYHVTQN